MGARTRVQSKLKVSTWEEVLTYYWDKQLVELLRFGFPLDFNRQCNPIGDAKSHSSATQYPNATYLQEKIDHKAIISPFHTDPIPGMHFSPFMIREKPNSDSRRVIIDLSWPHGNLVNAGIDNNSYVGTEFYLTFPSIHHIINELKHLGPGSHLFKIDISRPFRHIKLDRSDYDPLGLRWDAT